MVAVHLRRPRTKELAVFLLPAVRYDQVALGARLIQFMVRMRGSSASVRSFLSRLVSCPPIDANRPPEHFCDKRDQGSGPAGKAPEEAADDAVGIGRRI